MRIYVQNMLALIALAGCAAGGTTSSGGEPIASDAGADFDGQDGNANVDAPPSLGKLAIFTSALAEFYGTKSGGVAEADVKCQGYATAAGLKGSFRAWMSDTTDAIDRVPAGGTWHVVGPNGTLGQMMFENRDAWAGGPRGDILDEYGKTSSEYFWTGTELGGTAGDTCDNWMPSSANKFGIVGDGNAVHTDGKSWTHAEDGACAGRAALLCFQYK